MPDMRDQRWGLELEFTGITRYEAAKILAGSLQAAWEYDGGGYTQYSVQDQQERKWTLTGSGSITGQRMIDAQAVDAGMDFTVKLTTPVCPYEEITTLQEILEAMENAGGFVNDSCSFHVRVDGSGHTPKSLRNMINIVASKNDLLYNALGIDENRQALSKKLDEKLLNQMNKYKPDTMGYVEDIWYSCLKDERGRDRQQQNHSSRDHFLNLHSFFCGTGMVEFRGFKSTLNGEKAKAAIHLGLAMCHQAKIQRCASRIVTQTDNPKYTFRTYLLRLGLIGDEFKSTRQHLLEELPGNIAWRDPARALHHLERLQSSQEPQQALEQPSPGITDSASDSEVPEKQSSQEPDMEPDFSM